MDVPPPRPVLRVETRAEALAVARFLLGPFASVKVRKGHFRVGVYLKPLVFTQVGEGTNWADALAQASEWAQEYFEGFAQSELEKDAPDKPQDV